MLSLLIEIIGVDVILSKATRYFRAVILDFDRCTLSRKVLAVGQKTITLVTCRHVSHTIIQSGEVCFTKCRDSVFTRFRNFVFVYGEHIASHNKTIGLVGKKLLPHRFACRNKGSDEICLGIPHNGKRPINAFA